MLHVENVVVLADMEYAQAIPINFTPVVGKTELEKMSRNPAGQNNLRVLSQAYFSRSSQPESLEGVLEGLLEVQRDPQRFDVRWCSPSLLTLPFLLVQPSMDVLHMAGNGGWDCIPLAMSSPDELELHMPINAVIKLEWVRSVWDYVERFFHDFSPAYVGHLLACNPLSAEGVMCRERPDDWVAACRKFCYHLMRHDQKTDFSLMVQNDMRLWIQGVQYHCQQRFRLQTPEEMVYLRYVALITYGIPEEVVNNLDNEELRGKVCTAAFGKAITLTGEMVRDCPTGHWMVMLFCASRAFCPAWFSTVPQTQALIAKSLYSYLALTVPLTPAIVVGLRGPKPWNRVHTTGYPMLIFALPPGKKWVPTEADKQVIRDTPFALTDCTAQTVASSSLPTPESPPLAQSTPIAWSARKPASSSVASSSSAAAPPKPRVRKSKRKSSALLEASDESESEVRFLGDKPTARPKKSVSWQRGPVTPVAKASSSEPNGALEVAPVDTPAPSLAAVGVTSSAVDTVAPAPVLAPAGTSAPLAEPVIDLCSFPTPAPAQASSSTLAPLSGSEALRQLQERRKRNAESAAESAELERALKISRAEADREEQLEADELLALTLAVAQEEAEQEENRLRLEAEAALQLEEAATRRIRREAAIEAAAVEERRVIETAAQSRAAALARLQSEAATIQKANEAAAKVAADAAVALRTETAAAKKASDAAKKVADAETKAAAARQAATLKAATAKAAADKVAADKAAAAVPPTPSASQLLATNLAIQAERLAARKAQQETATAAHLLAADNASLDGGLDIQDIYSAMQGVSSQQEVDLADFFAPVTTPVVITEHALLEGITEMIDTLEPIPDREPVSAAATTLSALFTPFTGLLALWQLVLFAKFADWNDLGNFSTVSFNALAAMQLAVMRVVKIGAEFIHVKFVSAIKNGAPGPPAEWPSIDEAFAIARAPRKTWIAPNQQLAAKLDQISSFNTALYTDDNVRPAPAPVTQPTALTRPASAATATLGFGAGQSSGHQRGLFGGLEHQDVMATPMSSSSHSSSATRSSSSSTPVHSAYVRQIPPPRSGSTPSAAQHVALPVVNRMAQGGIAMLPPNTSSSQYIGDTYGQAIHFQKNDGMHTLGVQSGTFRTICSEDQVNMLTGMHPCSLNMFTVENLSHHAAEMHTAFQLAEGLEPRPSLVWQQYIFVRLDPPTVLKAIFVRFVRYPQLRADSVHLCYFMQSTPANPHPVITSWDDLRMACKGLEDFMEMFIGWKNVFRNLMDQFTEGLFEDYSVEYILSEIYTALCCLSVLALDAVRAVPCVRRSSEFYLEALIEELAQIRVRTSWERSQVFKPNRPEWGPTASVEGTSLTAVVHKSSTPVKEKKRSDQAASPRSTETVQLCMRDLRHHYKLSRPDGSPFPVCELPCRRVHYASIPSGTTKDSVAATAERTSFPPAAGVELIKAIRADAKFV